MGKTSTHLVSDVLEFDNSMRVKEEYRRTTQIFSYSEYICVYIYIKGYKRKEEKKLEPLA